MRTSGAILSKTVIVALLPLSLSPFAARAEIEPNAQSGLVPNVIYGNDDRIEVDDEPDPRKRTLARSTVALIPTKDMLPDPQAAAYDVVAESYGEAFLLCPNEKFASQPVPAICSGALVAPDLVLTASHCVPDLVACLETAFVFDFKIARGASAGTDAAVPTQIPEANIFRCLGIAATGSARFVDDGNRPADYTLIRLDRLVDGRRPLRPRSVGELPIGESVFTIGHPAGLPAKISGNAQVRERRAGLIVTNLDTFAGNSGSPVFSERTHELEGIVVSGEVDFEKGDSCFSSKICPDSGCRGEDALPIAAALTDIRSAGASVTSPLQRNPWQRASRPPTRARQ